MGSSSGVSVSDLSELLQHAGFVPGVGSPAIEAHRVREQHFGSPRATIGPRHQDFVLERADGQVIAASVVEIDGRPAVLAVPMERGMRSGHFPMPYELTADRLRHRMLDRPGAGLLDLPRTVHASAARHKAT